MKFYDLPASPNTRRVRIFMAEKGLDIPMTPINMMENENKTEEYLAKNSLGRMPVLELDDGTCIAESVAICKYLEELHPEPPLLGRDALDKAMVEMWQRRMEFELLNPIINVFRHTADLFKGRIPQVPEMAEVEAANVKENMQWLEKELEGKQYIANDEYTIADITAQCAFVMAKAALGIRIPDEMPNLTQWWERVTSRPTARA
ncbi:MAG: glutathione S-transferase family protein [Gammaproteobacteria bacterium]|nr:glutathione S-transferase family protein [Gammaproteobacteria bacterium]MDD9896624.1 glutathione S-transferase family protein [Gammaproteobacteria bacterium]MDD9958042.1 glutathione S-transferase family protein [Gammaproteobacteria bacterium]